MCRLPDMVTLTRLVAHNDYLRFRVITKRSREDYAASFHVRQNMTSSSLSSAKSGDQCWKSDYSMLSTYFGNIRRGGENITGKGSPEIVSLIPVGSHLVSRLDLMGPANCHTRRYGCQVVTLQSMKFASNIMYHHKGKIIVVQGKI